MGGRWFVMAMGYTHVVVSVDCALRETRHGASLKVQSTDRCVFNIRSFNVAMGNKGHHSLWHSPKKIDHAIQF